MRYVVPDIRVASEALGGHEKLGGAPQGLPASSWPKCSECGKSQSLLAQFEHHPERLDLGRKGRVIFVFQCNHDPGMCSTWEALSGANACFVVEPEDLTDAETPVPSDAPPQDREVRIIEWHQRDDGLASELASNFRNDEAHMRLAEETHAKITWGTRLGGFPKWIQSADEAPKGWAFVGQLDSSYSFLSPPKGDYSWVKSDPDGFEGRTHVAEGPNFGFGLGYILLRRGSGVPEGCFFWQR